MRQHLNRRTGCLYNTKRCHHEGVLRILSQVSSRNSRYRISCHNLPVECRVSFLSLGDTVRWFGPDRTANNLCDLVQVSVGIGVPSVHNVPNQVHRVLQRPSSVRRRSRVCRTERSLSRMTPSPCHAVSSLTTGRCSRRPRRTRRSRTAQNGRCRLVGRVGHRVARGCRCCLIRLDQQRQYCAGK